jgi:hypothetical protein
MDWFHAYVVVTYVVSLRGPEVALGPSRAHRNWEVGSDSTYFFISTPWAKGEQYDRCHLILAQNVTSSRH